ncbi:MAG TPA: SpoIID/LytB domain-containing protein [Drouetiella sp.]
MEIRVGLTTNDLTKLFHDGVTVSSPGGLSVSPTRAAEHSHKVAPEVQVRITSKGGALHLAGVEGVTPGTNQSIFIHANGTSQLVVNSLKRAHGAKSPEPHYVGSLEIKPTGGQLRIILITTLENYIKGVLQSEIPASYELEAVKAQAVAARTYALRPRIDHGIDLCNVCDSYLCCQYFAGVETISARHTQAIADTSGQILTYNGKPILALFSSNAGGCTEDYQNCFSDPNTNEFPPPALPYLQSVSEKDFALNTKSLSEADLRKIWSQQHAYPSADAWSPHFFWHVTMPASALEAHMHHEISVLQKDPMMTPFIVPPTSEQFGHINNLKVLKRGKSGTAIELAVETSTGTWVIKKELVIRSIFKNSELSLARLKSAKLFFDFKRDSNGLLTQIVASGLGWGHGVGMQQTGAQGWAKREKNYKEILGHYFPGSEISDV